MSWSKPKVGAIFGIPLLRGGYTFGCITAHPARYVDYALVNIFDMVSDSPEPPSNMEELSVALFDLQITKATTFNLDKIDENPWFWVDRTMVRVDGPRDRYAVMEMTTPLRIDMTGGEPDVQIDGSQLSQHQPLRMGGGLIKTARAEVAVRHLAVTPHEFLEQFLEQRAKTTPPASRAPTNNKSGFKPFDFSRDKTDDSCSLIWTDALFSKYKNLFATVDVECNGYAWTEIVKSLVKREQPRLATQLAFDPEAGTVSISGPKPALKQVAEMFQKLLEDEKALKEAISKAGSSAGTVG